MVIIGVVFAIASIGTALKAADKHYREKHGLPPRPLAKPRADGHLNLHGLTPVRHERTLLQSKGVTAVTPRGIRGTARCPQRGGYRSPVLAVKCVQADKARIERIGR
jgi:hypothetical protein